jgi:hypothetical protein
VWVLTLSDIARPEADELTGELRDKANSLPAVVGTQDEVRTLIGRLNAAGLLRKSREIRLLTLDGQTARAQSGADEPSLVATNVSDVGQTNSIQYRSVGTIAELTPRIDTQSAIQVNLVYSSSHLVKSADVAVMRPKEGPQLLADRIVTQQINTLARLKSGTAALVWSDAMRQVSDEGAEGETKLMILAAAVIPQLDAAD